ncbi:MAG TPA: GyrI-like domain-containing protein [Candidatus Saccharimonadia bacterium]
MEKLDVKREYKHLYRASSQAVSEVVVPGLPFMMVDGAGDPNGPAFSKAVQALYTLSYTLKFWAKKHEAPAGWREFSVAPLEGLWDVPGVDGPFAASAPRNLWRWTVMIMQPAFITPELVASAQTAAAERKPEVDTSLVRLERFEEGRSVQIMHIGPYSTELPSIMKLDAYMNEHQLTSQGRHHEIYLSDPMKTAPERLKTILRHPVTPA